MCETLYERALKGKSQYAVDYCIARYTRGILIGRKRLIEICQELKELERLRDLYQKKYWQARDAKLDNTTLLAMRAEKYDQEFAYAFGVLERELITVIATSEYFINYKNISATARKLAMKEKELSGFLRRFARHWDLYPLDSLDEEE